MLLSPPDKLDVRPTPHYAIFFSPYAASITGNGDEVSVCRGTGPEQGFSIVLQPGQRISIGQVSNTFGSTYTLRHGGMYPGESEVSCEYHYGPSPPDPLEESTYTNNGILAVNVYFVVDTHSIYTKDHFGSFELAWVIDIPGI